MILLRSFLSGHIRIKRTLEYYDAGIGPRVPFGGGFGPTVSANFAVALGDFDTLSSTSTMPTGGSISRAGNAMLYAVDGGVAKLTYAPNNLGLQSQTFNTGWILNNILAFGSGSVIDATAAPNNTTTADQLTESTGTVQPYVYQTAIGSAGSYVASVYAKPNGRSWVALTLNNTTTWFNVSTGSFGNIGGGTQPSITNVGNDWYRCSIFVSQSTATNFVVSFSSANGGASYTGDGTSGVFVWGGQVEAVTYQTTPSTYVATTTSAYYGPRFDYDPVTLQPKGLLVEGTRTNETKYSQALSTVTNGYAQAGITSIAENVTGPDGTSSLSTITGTNTSEAHFIYSNTGNIATLSGNTVGSCYAKAGTCRYLQISVGDASGNGYYTTIDTGVTPWVATETSKYGTAVSVGTPTIQSVGNSIYRITLPGVLRTTAGNHKLLFGFSNSATPGTVFPVFANSGTIIVGCVQLEAANFASSYIPTVASTVTRAAETFSLTGYANRLVEAYYIDEETGANYSGNSALSTGTVTISPPTFGWVTSLRAYTNAYAGSISTPSWLSFSRAGGAMYYDSTGTLTWAPANLAQQSGDVSAAFWASGFDAGNTTTSSSINFTSASGYRLAPFSTGIAVGQTYIFSCVMSSGTKSTANLRLYDNGGGAGANVNVTLTSTPTRYSVIWTTTNSPTAIYFGWDNRTAAGGDGVTGSFNVSQMQLERVTYQTAPSAYIPTTSAAVYGPRYDYDPSTVPATPRGLLIEESRANLLTYSEQFNNWLISDATVSANSVTSPDGTTTADKIVETTATTADHYVRRDSLPSYSGSYTYSIYAKAAGRQYLQLATVDNSTPRRPIFDLVNGTVVSAAGTTAFIVPVGNGWYRCGHTYSYTSLTQVTAILQATSTYQSYAGDGVSGVFLWGAQLEAGSFATSYIPTTTDSVTRAADVAKWTSAAFSSYWSASAGTMAVEGTAYTYGMLSVSDGTSNNRYYIIYNVSGKIQCGAVVGGVDQATLDSLASGYTAGTVYRTLFAYKANDFAAATNNGTVVPDTSGTLPTVSELFLGSYWPTGTAGLASGHIRSFAYYNQRLPDTILKQKSSVNAPY